MNKLVDAFILWVAKLGIPRRWTTVIILLALPAATFILLWIASGLVLAIIVGGVLAVLWVGYMAVRVTEHRNNQ